MIELDNDNIDNFLWRDGLLVIKAYTNDCKPCKDLHKELEGIDDKYKGKHVVFGQVDVTKMAWLADEYSIYNIPTVLFMYDKQLLDKIVGAAPIHVYEQKIDELLNQIKPS